MNFKNKLKFQFYVIPNSLNINTYYLKNDHYRENIKSNMKLEKTSLNNFFNQFFLN